MTRCSSTYEPSIHELVAASGVSREKIAAVMEVFYRRVKVDPVLGPVFRSVIDGDDWTAHVATVSQFWTRAFGLDGAYPARQFMPAHLRHDMIQPRHLAVWLALFDLTLQGYCTPAQAAAFRAIARAMAGNLRLGLAGRDAPPQCAAG